MEVNVIKEMIGVEMKKVYTSSPDSEDELVFEAVDGRKFIFRHHRDCCESVSIEDIVGDLEDLEGVISEATESSEDDPQAGESGTWTFYRFAAAGKGTVTVRWYGSSNGYYSESVYLDIFDADGNLENSRW